MVVALKVAMVVVADLGTCTKPLSRQPRQQLFFNLRVIHS
jgi:hypothetical protein